MAELLIHPACKGCSRIVHHLTGPEDARRYFCIGYRTKGEPVVPVDEYNFCVCTPYKGVVQFQVYAGDFRLWIALFYAGLRAIEGKHMPLSEPWLGHLIKRMIKEAKGVQSGS